MCREYRTYTMTCSFSLAGLPPEQRPEHNKSALDVYLFIFIKVMTLSTHLSTHLKYNKYQQLTNFDQMWIETIFIESAYHGDFHDFQLIHVI